MMMPSVFASPIVISDSGKTYPMPSSIRIKPVLQPITEQDIASIQARFSQQASAGFFPLTTRLTPGEVKPKIVNLIELKQPLFLVGSDNYSLDWLARYQSLLKENNAIGFIVQASSLQDIERLQKAANGLPLYPASGDELGAYYEITHYPALISKSRIEQ